MKDTVKHTIKQRLRMRKDRKRLYRIIERFEFPSIVEGSPVQLQEGYTICDNKTHELFACFAFQNLSEKDISSLTIRLLLYRDVNIPYIKKIYFTYSAENAAFGIRRFPGKKEKRSFSGREKRYIRPTEFFGKASYIGLPDGYFRKIEFELVSVGYRDGSTEKLGIAVENKNKKMSDLDFAKKYAYEKLNKYKKTENVHPAVVLPQKSENAWICCCGHKNMISLDECEECGRSKDWEFAELNEKKLNETVLELKRANDHNVMDKVRFKGYEKPLTEDQIYEKKIEYQKVLRSIAEQEEKKEHNRRMIIPKVIMYYAAVMLILFILYLAHALITGNPI